METIPSAFVIVELAKGDPLKAAQLSASLGWGTDTIEQSGRRFAEG
ncbi:hypothetical protein [Enterococcus hulanensis]|nr:hypothetical protein [Enterococcus hulanensis]